MLDFIRLLNDRRSNLRIRVPDADRQDAAEAVEIFIARLVPDVFALAPDQRDRLLIISGDRRKKKLPMFANGFGNRCFSFCRIHKFNNWKCAKIYENCPQKATKSRKYHSIRTKNAPNAPF